MLSSSFWFSFLFPIANKLLWNLKRSPEWPVVFQLPQVMGSLWRKLKGWLKFKHKSSQSLQKGTDQRVPGRISSHNWVLTRKYQGPETLIFCSKMRWRWNPPLRNDWGQRPQQRTPRQRSEPQPRREVWIDGFQFVSRRHSVILPLQILRI